jgi:Ni2+-binding GTPase involved in maturation of urease and hydrogenase
MHRAQLQYGHNDRLSVYVIEVTEGQNVPRKRKT